MDFVFDAQLSAARLADLRAAVGWNRMESDLASLSLRNAFHLCCFNGEQLVGYAAVVSNGVTDAYIQDVMVHPDWQRQGIGTALLTRMLDRLRRDGVFMVSIIYGDPALQGLYERFGFQTMLCGQMEMHPARDARNR